MIDNRSEMYRSLTLLPKDKLFGTAVTVMRSEVSSNKKQEIKEDRFFSDPGD